MTVAMWLLTSFMVVAITLIVMGASLRPYVAELVRDRNDWQARAVAAEAEVEAHIATDVTLVEPIDPSETLDIWMKGMAHEAE